MTKRELSPDELKLYQAIVSENVHSLSKDIVALVSRLNELWKKAERELKKAMEQDLPASEVLGMIPNIDRYSDRYRYAADWVEKMARLDELIATHKAMHALESLEPEGTDGTKDRDDK